MSSLEYISVESVKELLEWSSLISTLEKSLIDVSRKDGTVIVPPRLFMRIPDREGFLLNMPGYSKAESSFGCKLVSTYPNNIALGIPSIFATILLFDPETGKPKAVVDGGQITGWRTAAVSAVATKYMHSGEKNILGIIGAGVQAEAHILAFSHLFKFKKIKIWNKTMVNAENLASKLTYPIDICETIEDCCKDADVICTTTYSPVPYLKLNWLKSGVHINAVGANQNHYSEVEEEIYRNSYITVEHHESALNELKGLLEKGIDIKCEIGEFISKGYKIPQGIKYSLFQSLGLAIEDVAAANLVYNKYIKKKEDLNSV